MPHTAWLEEGSVEEVRQVSAAFPKGPLAWAVEGAQVLRGTFLSLKV